MKDCICQNWIKMFNSAESLLSGHHPNCLYHTTTEVANGSLMMFEKIMNGMWAVKNGAPIESLDDLYKEMKTLFEANERQNCDEQKDQKK